MASLAPHGIFASFDCAHRWIRKPALGPCVLVGDAAATSDPAWGNGLSRTLRDIRMLSDRLINDANWVRAAAAYADDHDEQFMLLRRAERLNAAIFFRMGDSGERLREHAFAQMERYPGLYPDLGGTGPVALPEETIALFLPEGMREAPAA